MQVVFHLPCSALRYVAWLKPLSSGRALRDMNRRGSSQSVQYILARLHLGQFPT
jgi:hypothetical protein